MRSLLLPLTLVLAACSREPASPSESSAAAAEAASGAGAGDTLEMFESRPIGDAAAAGSAGLEPMVAHVRVADLDADGRLDVLACDVAAGRVTWLRQQDDGTFHERPISGPLGAPVHAEPCDLDGDGDRDVLVACMGVMLPNNDRIGSVVVLEHDGAAGFTTRVLIERVARVTDVEPGDLDGDGDLDLVVGQFGYDQGEIRWMEQGDGGIAGDWSSHPLLDLAGTIHTPVADMDGDGDLDVVALVSQEWEEIHVFENDGRGSFRDHIAYGAATDDYSSSGIRLADLDGDGDIDVAYSNGDAFVAADYRPLPIHGVQWLENTTDPGASPTFVRHRIGDYFGAYGPTAADLDADGDIDLVFGSCFNYWDRPETRSLQWYERTSSDWVAHGIAAEPTHIVTVDAGDFDGDGRPDLVTGGMALYPPFDRVQRLTLWRNRGP